MDQKLFNAIQYVKAAITDAVLSESRPTNQTQAKFFGFQDHLIIVFKCPFDRVIRKVYYKLRNNFYDKTGLKFVLVNRLAEHIDLWEPTQSSERVNTFWVNHQIDLNHTIGMFQAFGSCYALDTFKNLEFRNPDAKKSEELGHSLFYQKFVTEQRNGEYPEYLFGDITEEKWKAFCEDARAIYPDWRIGSFKIKELS